MDDFLTKLFHEDLEKHASIQAGEMMEHVPTSELEEYLGLRKMAVDGSALPPLPDPAQGAELNAQQKAVSENVNKEHLSSVPNRSDGADVHVSYQGEGTKQPEEHEDEALQTSKQAMAYADAVGRLFAKTAAAAMALPPGGVQQTHTTGFVPVGSGMGALKGGVIGGGLGLLGGAAGGARAGGVPGALMGAGLGALGGGGIGAGSGALASLLKRVQLKSDQKQIQRLNQALREAKKEKKSQFAGGEMGDEGGMETTASIKADIAARALRAVEGAPEHIKFAAAAAAARQMTKSAGIGQTILKGGKSLVGRGSSVSRLARAAATPATKAPVAALRGTATGLGFLGRAKRNIGRLIGR